MSNNSSKRLSSCISLDLDNQWSYMKIHGDKEWENYPSYLNIFVPYVIDILNELDIKITFFVVGKDADINENADALKLITKNNHEVGNHSYNHESWLHLYSKGQIEDEILRAEEAIIKVTGQKPIGFRGPGFSWSYNLLETLFEFGYLFDASTLPTFIGPLARMYYFKTANLTKEERKDRKELFGKFADGFRKLKPYFWELSAEKKLLEIPVSTMPIFKTPFHLSYLIYLNNISPVLMSTYLKTAINLCKITKTEPSFLLHPLDLIGGDQIKQLAFFPGMNVKSKDKTRLFIEIINELKRNFSLVSMNTFTNRILNDERNHLKIFRLSKVF
jgi:hypothetical protein